MTIQEMIAAKLTNQQAMGVMVLTELKANGGNLQSAFDKVFGEGAYADLAAQVYESMQAA